MTTTVEVALERVACDLCGSSDHAPLFVGADYRFGRKGQYAVVQCNSCGLVFLNPRPTQETLVRLYEADYPDEGGDHPAAGWRSWETLRRFWHQLSGYSGDRLIARVKGRVVDVGCGYGKLMLPLRQKGCEVYGTEVNANCVAFCRATGLNVVEGTLEDARLPTDFADSVILSQVLEHVPSPKRTLQEIHRILRPNGTAYVFCPNGEGYLRDVFGRFWHGWHIPFHLYVLTAETITRLADHAGLRVAVARTVTPTDFLTTSLKSSVYGARDGVRPSERGKMIDSLAFRAMVSPPLRLLDVLLKRRGDCLEVELVKPA